MNKSSTIKNIVRYNVHVDEISFHQTFMHCMLDIDWKGNNLQHCISSYRSFLVTGIAVECYLHLRCLSIPLALKSTSTTPFNTQITNLFLSFKHLFSLPSLAISLFVSFFCCLLHLPQPTNELVDQLISVTNQLNQLYSLTIFQQ